MPVVLFYSLLEIFCCAGVKTFIFLRLEHVDIIHAEKLANVLLRVKLLVLRSEATSQSSAQDTSTQNKILHMQNFIS